MSDLDLTRYDGHTPGPWTTEDVMGDGPIDVCGPRIHEAGFPNLIATALTDKGVGGDVLRGLAEAIANARLIADAPLLLAEVRRLRVELDELRDGVEAAGLEYREDDGPASYWRNTPALDAEHELRALRQSHARLLAAAKADADKIMPDGTLCWCADDRYYGEHGFNCSDLRAAVAEAEALNAE